MFLKRGDVIGVAAPSARFDRALFDRGVACLKSMGFEVRIPEGIFGRHRYLAGADGHRAGIVNALFADPDVRGVISVRGGFGAMRILDYLDWDGIRTHPTLFMGFSDASALISSLMTECGMASIHGPNLVSLATAGKQTLEGFYSAVTGRLKGISLEKKACIRKGKARGRLVGGNLATLSHMIGTRFQPVFDDGVLFIEDVGEPAYKIDRMLSQMKMAGLFRDIRGVVAGSFEDCDNQAYIPEILSETFRDRAVPILMGLESGHGAVNLSLIMGEAVTLDADGARLVWGADGP